MAENSLLKFYDAHLPEQWLPLTTAFGEILSPLLFNLYISEVEKTLKNSEEVGVNKSTTAQLHVSLRWWNGYIIWVSLQDEKKNWSSGYLL